MMLKNKVSLITGSSGGIGISLIKKFSENGSDIICCARKKTQEFENTLKEISKKMIIQLCRFILISIKKMKF